jgi:hypothetical protein
MSSQILVSVNNVPKVVTPNTSIVTKQGKKQFWYYDNGKAKLAVQVGGAKWVTY